MRCRQCLPALVASLAVLVGAVSTLAQQAAIAPPANVTVHRVGDADFKDAVCTGKMDLAVSVPAKAWVQVPLGWFAVDEATARANWKSMAYTVTLADKPVPVARLRWETSSVKYECPTQTYAGFAMGPVLYVPPSAAEQVVRVEFTLKDDVFDGWYTFKKGSNSTLVLRLQPVAAKAAPAVPPAAAVKPLLTLPQLTDEQKWSRLQMIWGMWVMASAAQAKSLGKSTEDYGRFVGHVFAPGWNANLTPAGLLRGWYLNASLFKTTNFQVLEVSDSVARARANRPWVPMLGNAQDVGGMTPADLDDVLAATMQQIADEHGLKFEQVRDGDDIVLTVRRK